MGTVFLGWSLAGRLWGDHAAMAFRLDISLFPYLNSLFGVGSTGSLCLVLFADCFAWCYSLDAVKWYKAYHIGDDGVHGSHIFSWRHGSRSICVPVFLRFSASKGVFGNGQRTPNPTVKYFAGNLYCSIIAVFSGKVVIPKIGSFESVTDISYIFRKVNEYTAGSIGVDDAGYPPPPMDCLSQSIWFTKLPYELFISFFLLSHGICAAHHLVD